MATAKQRILDKEKEIQRGLKKKIVNLVERESVKLLEAAADVIE